MVGSAVLLTTPVSNFTHWSADTAQRSVGCRCGGRLVRPSVRPRTAPAPAPADGVCVSAGSQDPASIRVLYLARTTGHCGYEAAGVHTRVSSWDFTGTVEVITNYGRLSTLTGASHSSQVNE